MFNNLQVHIFESPVMLMCTGCVYAYMQMLLSNSVLYKPTHVYANIQYRLHSEKVIIIIITTFI